MRTIGGILKEKRREKGKKITQIAAQLKIRRQYLLSLEKDDFQSIPGGVATIQGIVRHYARALDLDPEKMAAIFRRDFINPKDPQIILSQLREKRHFSWSPRDTFLLIVAVLGLFLLVFFLTNLFNFLGNPSVKIISPRENQEILSETVVIKGRIKRADVVRINNQPIVVGDSGYFEEEIDCEQGENTILIEASNPRKKKAQAELSFTCR